VFAWHVGVQFEWVRGEEIMAIYQASRAGGLRYVEFRRFTRDGKDDVFMLARETHEDDASLVVVTSKVPQSVAAPYLLAARAYSLENNQCSAFERALIAQVPEEDIGLLALDVHG
jgi:hypothetical protein